MSTLDRERLVRRHNVVVTDWRPCCTLSVGNGDFAVNVDVTGLQTFPQLHEPAAPPPLVPDERGVEHVPVREFDAGDFPIPLRIQSSWGWYSTEPTRRWSLADVGRDYQTQRGPVRYPDDVPPTPGAGEPGEAATWLFNNPRRLDLGRIGLRFPQSDVGIGDVRAARIELDLWTGLIHSRFEVIGGRVEVWTVADPERSVAATRVRSALLADGQIELEIACPDQHDALAIGERLEQATRRSGERRLERSVGDARYVVAVETDGNVRPASAGFRVHTSTDTVSVTVGFSPDTIEALPAFDAVRARAAAHWRRFWTTGAAVSFEGSRDPRAHELERRVVLSQYLTAVHCSGTQPPQESGLIHNSWGGKFHLEMHWWHAAHFALWGRPELLERSLGWYRAILPRARETASRQGYAGARWPKQVGPDGRESPSMVGAFIVWQQPHPIYFAELLRLAGGGDAVLERYRDIVFATAEFMADFAEEWKGAFHIGPPVVPAQESYYHERARTYDPTFELAYWHWGLETAQRWRERHALERAPKWDEVARRLARPPIRDGVYAAVASEPYTIRNDHPSMLMALGFLPSTPLVDESTMAATFDDVRASWDLHSTWGWDYPVLAMCAAKLGRPAAAVDSLMMDTYKNQHLPNGHVPQLPGLLSVYLPANGGLLAAIAMMVAGWDGAARELPGFPDDGSWQVTHEGLNRFPPDLSASAAD